MSAMTMLDPLLTRDQLAEYLQVSPRQVDKIRGKLPRPVYVGRLPRWPLSRVKDWLEAQMENS